jgi:anti-sigma factor RsiW
VKRKRGAAKRPSGKGQTCRDVIGLLTEYMEGGLAPAVARRLETHLGNCSACEGFLETLRATRAAVRGLHPDDIPEDCHTRLRAFLDRELKSGRI